MFDLIIFTDSKGSYDFGGKRQSKDSRIMETIIDDYIDDRKVYTTSRDTETLLRHEGFEGEIVVIDGDSPIPDEDEDAVLMIEVGDFRPFMPFVDDIYIVNWGRNYLGERVFRVFSDDWVPGDVDDYVGSSHEAVSIEEWYRR